MERAAPCSAKAAPSSVMEKASALQATCLAAEVEGLAHQSCSHHRDADHSEELQKLEDCGCNWETGSTLCPSVGFSRCSSPGRDEDGFSELAQSPRLLFTSDEDEDKSPSFSDSEASTATGSSRELGEACREAVEQALAPLVPIPQQRRTETPVPLVHKRGARLAIIFNGSLGDAKPLIALAVQLRLFRHTVRLFAPMNFMDVCRSCGLDAVPIFADSRAVIIRNGGMVPDFIEASQESLRVAEAWHEENPGVCEVLWDALVDFEPQAILAHTPGVAYRYEAEKGVPVMQIYLSRMGLDLLKSYSKIQPVRPSFYAFNPLLQARVSVIPGLHHTAEWVIYQEPSKSALADGGQLADLRRFLGSGPAPVAVGWGSLIPKGMKPQEMLALALRALRLAGRRGVILGGWADLEKLVASPGWSDNLGEDGKELAAFAAENVCLVSEAPHEWLFPQCCAVVHHGGAGTLHSALRAGKPAVVTPIFFDQFGHATVVSRLGAGIGFEKKLQELSAEELARAISTVEAKTPVAVALGNKLRQQVGERDAATIIDEFVRSKVMTGLWGKPLRTALRLKSAHKS